MAFDFPASPTIGDVSNGYTYDGMGWRGGPGISGPQTEQYFQLPAGSAPLDIQVPTWATTVQLIGAIWGSGPLGAGVRISLDGTTFLAGAADYTQAGPVLNTGTSVYQAYGTASADCLWLVASADNANYPHQFTAELELKRPDTARVIAMKTFGRSLDSSAGASHRTLPASSYVSAAQLGSNLAVKAIRIFPRSGSWSAGSWLNVKWLGDSAAIPQTNAIADCPSDGGEYVRRNGVWRLKSQTFVLDGLTTFDVDVPATAKVMRLDASVWWAAISANNAVTWRASVDGTNFQAGASDYFYGGLIHYSGSSGYLNLAPANEAFGRLSFPGDTTTQPIRIRWLLQVVKSTNTNALHAGTVNVGYYNTPASNGYTDAQLTTGVQSGANLSIKKLRFFNGPVGGAFGNGSFMIFDWMY